MNIIVGIATLVVAAAFIMPNAFAVDEPEEEVIEVTVEEATVEAPAEAKTEDEVADEA